MKKDIIAYVAQLLNYQQVKYEHQRPGGLFQKIKIPKWKWERIAMDLICRLPLTQRKFNAVWVIVYRLTKSAHFIPVAVFYFSEQLVEIYIREIVRLHGVIVSIISNQEFAYNNSYQSSIQMATYKALYCRRCRSPVVWFDPGEARLLCTDLVKEALDKVKIIQDRLHTAQSRQKSYADRKFRDMASMVRERVVGKVSYEFVLPPRLSIVHPVFHVSMLRKYHGDPSHVLDFSTIQLDTDLTYEEEPVAILDRQVSQLRSKSYPSVRVQWRGQLVEAASWEFESDM
ncbi:uncharacterized protein [Nicotiana sylvestris]|uniref:uncharacterized protein n=1 Tax=Nicotiana sylvestris TaxID=4096 RepID=UPI00388CC318